MNGQFMQALFFCLIFEDHSHISRKGELKKGDRATWIIKMVAHYPEKKIRVSHTGTGDLNEGTNLR
jgi:hypothetical protein